mmetsp:Transcript_10951/g.29381  ORF Transcript_10951/g.29381 Transcript_10951/m.29381 type:complete len:94 (+) Transcript_10951:211-492(+)
MLDVSKGDVGQTANFSSDVLTKTTPTFIQPLCLYLLNLIADNMQSKMAQLRRMKLFAAHAPAGILELGASSAVWKLCGPSSEYCRFTLTGGEF